MNMNKKKNNEDYVREYQSTTDVNEKKRIADALYRKNYRLVVKYAGNMLNPVYGSQEDLIQEASCIFMKCLNKFNPNKKIKFSTYFGDACYYELRRYKNKQMKHVDNSYFLEIDEILQARPENIEDKIDDTDTIQKFQDTLLKLNQQNQITDKQFYTVCEEHGFFGCNKKTRKEMAEERNCTLQNVGFLYRKGMTRVKDELEKNNVI